MPIDANSNIENFKDFEKIILSLEASPIEILSLGISSSKISKSLIC